MGKDSPVALRTPRAVIERMFSRHFEAGDQVHARWVDGRFYPGTIVSVHNENRYHILFTDGDCLIVDRIDVCDNEVEREMGGQSPKVDTPAKATVTTPVSSGPKKRPRDSPEASEDGSPVREVKRPRPKEVPLVPKSDLRLDLPVERRAVPESVVATALACIRASCEELKASREVEERAMAHFTACERHGIFPTLNELDVQSSATAALFISCRQDGLACTYQDVCARRRLPKHRVSTLAKAAATHLGIDMDRVPSREFAETFCNTLPVPEERKPFLVDATIRAHAIPFLPAKNISSVTVALLALSTPASQKDVVEACAYTRHSVANIIRHVRPHLRAVFPADFQLPAPSAADVLFPESEAPADDAAAGGRKRKSVGLPRGPPQLLPKASEGPRPLRVGDGAPVDDSDDRGHKAIRPARPDGKRQISARPPAPANAAPAQPPPLLQAPLARHSVMPQYTLHHAPVFVARTTAKAYESSVARHRLVVPTGYKESEDMTLAAVRAVTAVLEDPSRDPDPYALKEYERRADEPGRRAEEAPAGTGEHEGGGARLEGAGANPDDDMGAGRAASAYPPTAPFEGDGYRMGGYGHPALMPRTWPSFAPAPVRPHMGVRGYMGMPYGAPFGAGYGAGMHPYGPYGP